MHVDIKNKNIVPSNGPTHVLDNNTLTTEARYPINFTQSGKELC